MEEAVILPMRCPTLIGRAEPLATLRLFVEQAKQGEGHVALIGGEAGIGKSRLVTEIKTYATEQGLLLLQGNCFPTDLTYPYAPVLDLLRSLVASNPKLAVAVKALAHDIFPLLPELVPDQASARSDLEPEQEKRRLFALLATFFLQLSAQSPHLFVIEDMHWCDDTSLDFLHYLARRSVSQPLLLLATYRSDEMQQPLRSWLAQLNRERRAQQIQLVPLARNEIEAMLVAIFEQKHTAIEMRRFLHGELLDLLCTLTEGNPFFVEETIGSLVDADEIFYVQGYWNRRAGGEISIPSSVQDIVQRRTELLNEEARRILTLAAVAGRRFDFALLQQLTQYNEQQLLLLMKELVAAQLVVEESADQFAFRHALTRQAIYRQLLRRERSMLHKSIAETIEHSGIRDARLEELAYHFYQAGLWQKVVDYARLAGEKALQLYAHHAAIDYFTWALEASEHLQLAPSPALYRTRGQAYETLGEFEQAQHDYTGALNAARVLQERTAEWQSVLDLGFLWAGRDYAQAETWFRQALVLAQALDNPVLHAHSLNRIGNWHANGEQPHEALRYHREALAIFEQLHDPRGIAQTLDLLGMVSYLGGDLLQGTVYYQQAIPRFRELKDQQGLTSSLATLTLRGPTYQTDALSAAASLMEAGQDAEAALSIARAIGQRSAEAYALFQLGLCLGSQGEYGRALAAVCNSLDIAEETEHRQWQTAAHTVLGGIYSGLLAYSRARAHFEQALGLAREIDSLFWTRIAAGYLASTAVQLQDFFLAEETLNAVLNSNTPAETMAQRMLWCAAAELALAQKQPGRCLEITDRLNASGARETEERSSLRVLKLRGGALTLLQRAGEAEAAWVAAREIAMAQGARPMQWRICIALGNLYQAHERSAEAEQAFATARTLIAELAATVTDEHDDFLQAATALLPHTRPLSPRRAAREASGGLTAREREVAVQIAQGRFNREIADALVLSERTIETHVSNIMFKLGFTSRRQIASWAVEKGLTEKQ
jgi:DNA-binding CsgD family transcriptional regulator/tetratricopeptide (TPR) repeat protein